MYSVVIQNKQSLESFLRYQSIFSATMASGTMGVCKWNEAGTTIDTALPELRDLIDDKEEWRAIIIRYCDGENMSALDARSHNPYDFYANDEGMEAGKENPVPLVRLAQMLGGIPPMEVQFKAEVIKEQYKTPRTVYIPVETPEQDAAYRRLVHQYRFDGKPPSAILMITIREGNIMDDYVTKLNWGTYKESESSDFWKRNYFPSICRFMVYDVDYRGNSQREADDFGFWYAVMLMVSNRWESSVLQAYRLYLLQVTIDKPSMERAFQSLADRLRDARSILEKNVRRDIENQICIEEALPDYRLDISVPINPPKSSDRVIAKEKFPLLSTGATTDVATWAQHRKRVEEQLVTSIRSAERALDQTADRMRSSSTFTKDEVFALNKYQEEDMLLETHAIYQNVVAMQNTLLSEHAPAQADMQDASKKVKDFLLGRVTGAQAMWALLITAVLVALSFVPLTILCPLEGEGSIMMMVWVVIASLLIAILCAVGVLFSQKAHLKELVAGYNYHLKSAFNQLIERASDYSTYMSDIVSHSRGTSYLNLAHRKKRSATGEHYNNYRHIQEINVLLNKLQVWNNAYHLKVDFLSYRTEASFEIDLSTTPSKNKLYAFDVGEMYPVMINHSGMIMESPYPFASKIEITREELYDDK